MNRSATALLVLFAGVMALLILRYDPWIYALIIGNPLITLLAVATGAALLGIEVTRRVPEHKRGVVFKGERFDHIDARGVIPLLPGETIGAEIPLDEQRVRGWPIVVYDIERKERTIIFAMTWRLVPTSARPQTPRERRAMLMTTADRQRIVIETVERRLRDIARCLTLDQLNAALTDAECIEAIRESVDCELQQDFLTIDRLHMQRFMPTKKDDDPVAFRERRTVTETWDRQGAGQGKGHEGQEEHSAPPRLLPGPQSVIVCCPHGFLHDCPYGCLHVCRHGYERSCPHGCPHHPDHPGCHCAGRCQCQGQRNGKCTCECLSNIPPHNATFMRTVETIRGGSAIPKEWQPPEKPKPKPPADCKDCDDE